MAKKITKLFRKYYYVLTAFLTFDTSGLFVYKEFFKVQLIRELINHVLLYTGIKRPGALAYSSTCQNFAWGDIKNYVLKMGHDVLGATTLN